MEKAAARAREGDAAYFQALPPDELARLSRRRDEDKRSLLHSAAASGSLELCKLLLGQGGADEAVNDQDEEGWTPLQSAVSAGHEPVVQLLLQSGAEVNAANSGGRTALHYAASKGRPSMVRLLLAAGASAAAADSTGATPLHRAASAARVEAARVLAEEGRCALDARDRTGATPLLVAVQCDASSLAFYLASRGAGLEVANNEGETPLSAAGENAPALRRAAERGIEHEA